MSHQVNKTRIKAVANALGPLKEKVVFVGGSTVSFYSNRQAFETRPTEDVDVIVEILNYSQRTNLEERLRSVGFTHDIDSGIACRYLINNLIVDIMPTEDTSIGFNTKWYSEGFKKAIDYNIDDDITINILSPPYFVATKIEAFKNRGNGDGRTSKDFEDIVYILENRSEIWNEMMEADGEIKEFLITEFKKLYSNPNLLEWIDSHVERASPPSTYYIMDEIKKFCNF